MQPIDAITDIDENTIRSYISIYGGAECGPMNMVLNEWNKNKKTLFRALGRQLSVSKMISIPKSDVVITSELESIYHPYVIWYEHDKITVVKHFEHLQEITNNYFISDILRFWVNKDYCIEDLRVLSRLFLHKNLSKGYITSLEVNNTPYHCRDFKCTIKNGMKTIRTIQKVLKATGYPNMDLFEKWRNQVSLIQTEGETKAKLVISIHPIDFMSMSENKCNWRSCMGWSNSGCYNAGTLEMMNSNVAAVAYLETASPFEMFLNETGEVYTLPNKSWRSLIYVHKDILLLGKQYPFHNDYLVPIVLDMMRELVGKNLHWSYRFINQEYRDMEKLEGNFYVRDWFNLQYNVTKQHHSIFVYTNGMYNDIIEAKYPHYYCCRNYVPHSKKICLSGPATCICCGKRLMDDPRGEIYDYDDLGNNKLCYDCEHENCCRTCGKVSYYSKYYTRFGSFCSDDCAKDTIVFPIRHATCRKEDLQFNRESQVCLFADQDTITFDEWRDFINSFSATYSDQVNNWIRKQKEKFGERIRIYKVPKKLTEYRYADSAYYSCSESVFDIDNWWRLCLFIGNENKYKIREDRIKELQKRMPLLEYLEGGDK
jgi:hypothetical protein